MKPYSLAFLLALLAGCTVGPTYHAPKPEELLPQHFSAQESHAAISTTSTEPQKWWTIFRDPALDQLVDAGLQHSPDLESADANIRQARAGLKATDAAQSPQVNADGRIGHDQLSTKGEEFANIPFPNPQSGFNDYRAGFDASWEIDLFGHTKRSVEAATARLGSTLQQRSDAALRVSAEIARNVLDFRYWKLRYDNAVEIRDRNSELLYLTTLQRQAGVATNSDVIQAQVNLESANAQLPSLQVAQQAAMTALGPLTGLPHAQLAQVLEKSATRPALPDSAPAGLSSELLQRRPDLRIAERQLAAATADIGVAVADQYPRFSLVGSGGWDSTHPGSLGQHASQFWNIGPQFSIPILSGGRIDAEVKSSEAARDAALANYRKAVLLALADVESDLIRYQGDRDRSQKLQLVRSAQDKQLILAKQRYQVGETPKLDMLSVELQIAGTYDQQLATEQAQADDLVALFKALGGNAEFGSTMASNK
jgi:NodT family efflux transporter outer membrane factor (OMF) lipoprotein